MKFKSDLKGYWELKGKQLMENITIVSKELETKGFIEKIPVNTRYVYNIHLITENRLLAKQFFFKGDDIWIDGIKFYRGLITQKPTSSFPGSSEPP